MNEQDRGGPFGPAPEQNADGSCAGFEWLGQSFATCDGCGRPYWEHEFDMVLGNGGWERTPITPEVAASVKAKWGPR